MQAVLDSLLGQHRNLSRLVVLLERQPSLEPDPDAAHVGLLVDVLQYLTHFPDVSHHPLEDRMAGRLLLRNALDTKLHQELLEQHARLAQQGADLLRDLEGAMRRETISLELVALNARLYAERLRHNIAFEELVLFPSAASRLDDEDWRAIVGAGAGAAALADPLFSGEVDRRFAQLHRVIAAQASCGCEA